MAQCQDCLKLVSKNATTCPHCGTPKPTQYTFGDAVPCRGCKKDVLTKNKTCPFCEKINPTHKKCRKCKKWIAYTCIRCPKCKNRSIVIEEILGWIVVGIIVIVVINMFTGESPKKPQKTHEQVITEKIEQSFSWNGAHRGLQNFVKKNLKDPKSYEHIKTTYRHHKHNNTITVNMEYRAKNSFGGYVVETASAVADLNGNLVEIL
ncbi:MAG: RNA polymerase subunit RPABC4/transcription elongation factor Spt4 [Candidatus Deianiraeaceae bacterium]|jgi:RNA polymerase subunit RPABC4/transcription elongation factor Spt4